MKRIISIELQNFRAFYGKYDKIDLSNGENLLIYGENGSGKSSLFKALNSYFIRSRIKSTPFISNYHTGKSKAEIKIEFADFQQTPFIKIANTQKKYTFGKRKANNTVRFIQDADLVKGFLEYRNLLDIYLHKNPRPNLFSLIVETLLENHIPVRTGGNYRLGVKWKQLSYDLIQGTKNRKSKRHVLALKDLPTFQSHLEATLKDIFESLNLMLEKYFSELNIKLTYTLKKISLQYSKNKKDWKIITDLRLNIKKDGILITGDYSDLLNEARLSAFSICLYLSSLKHNPNLDLQILYLDDIFIGLDTGNRLPILEIVNSEFKDYQIFISTYDKGWFDIAKRYFTTHNQNGWKSIELYVGREQKAAITFDKPTIITSSGNYERAIRHLHDRLHPDYPASANYFRKAIEEIISINIPQYELSDNNLVLIPDHKLNKRLDRTRHFLKRTGNSLSAVNEIISLLHGLLHPLSHYTKISSIYKTELLRIERAIVNLEAQLSNLNIPNTYKCVLEAGKTIKLIFCVNQANNHYYYYEVILRDALVIQKMQDQSLEICEGTCHVKKFYGQNGNVSLPGQTVKKDKFVYNSLQTAYKEIYNHWNAKSPFAFPAAGYLSSCEWYGQNNWQPLSNIIIW
ncbi:AAA family ATPase [Longitalea arenae]|uniref:AAA family ATPase n=1 Tax=Longitalea arenae TaxID=2812558 RepID=UPI0019687267|nr:AAA family ATPase [Longitalea arenae]